MKVLLTSFPQLFILYIESFVCLLELSRVWTVLLCSPDSRTLAARNFHIKARRVQTKGYVVQTVDLMHAIFIYEARESGS
jgi:hypothetical protein